MLTLKSDELKQILESYGLIPIEVNNVKFVIDTSGHKDNYGCSIFRLENSLTANPFAKYLLLGLLIIKGICIILVLVMFVIQK